MHRCYYIVKVLGY